MREVYISRAIHIEPAVPVHYVYDRQVENGKVLVLRDLCATFTAIASTEEVHFFVDDGGIINWLGEDAPLDTGGHPFWTGKVAIGEHDRVGVYIPDSAVGDGIYFYIFGELWDMASWRKAQ